MKTIRYIAIFIIFYFVITIYDRMIGFGKWISQGNMYIEYGFYIFLGVLGIYFVIVPLVVYAGKPSMGTLARLAQKDRKAAVKVRRFYLKNTEGELRNQLEQLDAKDVEGIKAWAAGYLETKSTEIDKKIRSHALRLTAVVMISPNPFIDGLAVLFGNSRMLYELTKYVNLRYRWRDIVTIYFDNFTMSAATGIVQEYEDELEELFESLLEEFDEFLGEHAGVSIVDSIPGLKFLVQASGPIIQAAGNYGYVVFSGNKFKLSLLNCIEEVPLEKGELRKKARRIARKARYEYIKDMLKNVGGRGTEKMKKNLFGWAKKKDMKEF